MKKILLNEKVRSFLDKHSILLCHRKDQKRVGLLNEITISDFDEVEPFVGIYAGNNIGSIGSFSYSNSRLPPGLQIGRYCSIGSGLGVLGFAHPLDRISTSPFTYSNNNEFFNRALCKNVDGYVEPVKQKKMPSIGNDVWLGANVTLAKGVHVHDGAVVASNSLVTKDVPPYAIVGGNPAVIIKYRYSHDVISRSLHFRWWDYHVKDVVAANSHSLEIVISYLENSGCTRYHPTKIHSKDFDMLS